MNNIRTVVQEGQKNIIVMDVFSKLIQERIIFIDGFIDEELSNGVIAQMLYLDAQSQTEPINIYINSPGGSVMDGLAIYDTSEIIKAPIRTVCTGMAASMAAVLMLMGKERCMTKRSRIMLHQPSGNASGNLEEIRITFEMIDSLKKELYDIVEEKTNLKDAENLFKFDKWYTAKEALEVGLVTEILNENKD